MSPLEDTLYVVQTVTAMLIQNCPKDKGNLVQTIGYDVDNNTGDYIIFIGGDALLQYAKAPYATYTNERSNLHYRKVYPGQSLYKWIDRSLEQAMKLLGGN